MSSNGNGCSGSRPVSTSSEPVQFSDSLRVWHHLGKGASSTKRTEPTARRTSASSNSSQLRSAENPRGAPSPRSHPSLQPSFDDPVISWTAVRYPGSVQPFVQRAGSRSEPTQPYLRARGAPWKGGSPGHQVRDLVAMRLLAGQPYACIRGDPLWGGRGRCDPTHHRKSDWKRRLPEGLLPSGNQTTCRQATRFQEDNSIGNTLCIRRYRGLRSVFLGSLSCHAVNKTNGRAILIARPCVGHQAGLSSQVRHTREDPVL